GRAQRPLEPPLARSDNRDGERVDARAPARTAAQCRVAAGCFRSRRLGRAHRHHCRSRSRRDLDHARSRGSAAALVPAQPAPSAGPGAGGVRRRGRLMERFAALVDSLVYTRGRNGKLELIADYLHATPDPDRGWALAALTGGLDFPAVKPATIRNLLMER